MKNTQRRDESEGSTTTFDDTLGLPESVTKTNQKVIFFPQPVAPESPQGYKSIDDLVSKFEASDKGRAALARGRAWVAKEFYSGDGDTIRTLRLNRGMSQADLADRLGTSQSHVARIERGTENLLIGTCRRLCEALGIDMNTLNEALKRQETIWTAKTEC